MKPFRKIIGIALVVLGIIGCFLPVLQGILTIAVGLSIWLDRESRIRLIKRLKNFIDYVPAQYRPLITKLIENLEQQIQQKDRAKFQHNQMEDNY
jgi:uncharacterized membrane protein YbaN (DUF454 family)